MSVDIYVFVERDKMPTPEVWLKAIKDHGFALEMDTDFDVDEMMGFLPCKYRGEDAGFEYSAEEADLAELLDDELLTVEDATRLGKRTFIVTLSTGASFRDCISSLIASCVLCSISDGMLSECGEPPLMASGETLSWARKQETSLIPLIS